jgi:acyl-CoA synthetase (AMP-forming)/AMP-acid ligase II
LAALHFSAPGERVVVFSENRPEWITALFSIWRNRCVVVPIDAFSPAAEAAYVIGQTEPVAVFCSAKTRPVVAEALRALPAAAPRIVCFDGEDFPALPTGSDAVEPLVSGPADALAAILFTSGTTGEPKGVMLTFGNFQVNLASVCDRVPIFRPESRTFALLPFHHILPLMGCILAPLYSGGAIILAHSLDPADMVATMRRHRATILIGVPRLYALFRKAILDNLFKSPVAAACSACPPPSAACPSPASWLFPVQKKFGGQLRQMVSGGAPLDREVARDLVVCGFQVLEGYGMTECAPMITFPRPTPCASAPAANPACRIPSASKKAKFSPAARTSFRLLEESRSHRRSHPGRLAPHRRPWLPRQRQLPLHHRPQEGNHRFAQRQEGQPRRTRGKARRALAGHQGSRRHPARRPAARPDSAGARLPRRRARPAGRTFPLEPPRALQSPRPAPRKSPS